MQENLLPADGSILILDDRIEHALPLLKLLSKNGIATTYFSGKDDELPDLPRQKIRLAFVDIQLFGPSDSHSYAQNILRILDRVIPDNNGPYILIIWSTLETVHADTLESQVTSDDFSKRPVIVLRLEKSSLFQSTNDFSLRDELIEELESSLGSRFPEDDLNAIRGFLENNVNGNTNFSPVNNALELITAELRTKLIKANSFHLFTIWENLINKAAGEIVTSYSSLHPTDEYWEDNLKYSIYRMAHAQLGKTVDDVAENQLLRNSLKTMNSTFLDVLEKRISNASNFSGAIKIDRNYISFSKKFGGVEYKIKWKAKNGKFKLFIGGRRMPSGNPKETTRLNGISGWGGNQATNNNIKSLMEEYTSISPEINTKLLIDLSPSKSIQPGNVFVKKNIHWKRRRNLLKNYFKEEDSILFKKKADNTYEISTNEIKNFLFVELEVTPLCDYVQGKWRKSRLLPGILIPVNYYDKSILNPDSFYSMIPIIKINGTNYKPIFDFRLLKSIDIVKDDHLDEEPLFGVRSELFADILSRLSSHANRVGIAYIE